MLWIAAEIVVPQLLCAPNVIQNRKSISETAHVSSLPQELALGRQKPVLDLDKACHPAVMGNKRSECVGTSTLLFLFHFTPHFHFPSSSRSARALSHQSLLLSRPARRPLSSVVDVVGKGSPSTTLAMSYPAHGSSSCSDPLFHRSTSWPMLLAFSHSSQRTPSAPHPHTIATFRRLPLLSPTFPRTFRFKP